MADSSKTEKATPKKLRDERKKGNVALSKDAVSVITLGGACAVLFLLLSVMADTIGSYMYFCIDYCGRKSLALSTLNHDLFIQGLMILVRTVLPLTGVAILCSVAITFFQTRLLVSVEQIKPKFSRISPLQGIKRLFSLKNVIETLKGVLKISILLVLVYMSVRDSILESARYLYVDVSTACAQLLSNGKLLVIRIMIAFVAIAAADFFYQQWNFGREMRMTKQEIKDEYKQTEGDPQIKGKIREMQRRRAQTRMMQQVPAADVVIRNPSHFAVALRYRPGEDEAPLVLAKGMDELALRIVEVAENAGVAVIENVPLARALYAQAELNQQIPPDLYGAVAEVLVFIFRLDGDRQIVKDTV